MFRYVFSKEFLVSQVFTKTIQDGDFNPQLIIEQLKREFEDEEESEI